jgi:hypothetical protein
MPRDILSDEDVPDEALGLIFADTSQTKAVFRGLDKLFEIPRTANHAWGAAIIGPARLGKTSLIREYLSRCAEKDVADRRGPDKCTHVVRKPLRHLYVQLAPGTNLNNICSQTLAAMGDPDPTYGNRETRTRRVDDVLRDGKLDVVIYDEVHNLVDTDTLRVEQKAAHWISGRLDQGRCPMVLIGYTSLSEVLRRNPFLSGRLKPMPPLRAYAWDNAEDLADFRYVLSVLDGQLGFTISSDLADEGRARRLCYATSGLLGLLEKLLMHARGLAHDDRHSCLTDAILRQAVEDERAMGLGLYFNPFEVTDLKAAVRDAKKGRPNEEVASSGSLKKGRPS